MKFTTEAAPLRAAVKAAGLTVKSKNTIPILAFLYVDALGGATSLRGTDLDSEVSVTIPADIKAQGVTCLPAKMLSDILGKLADDASVTLELDKGGSYVTLKSGRSRFKLSTLAPDDFPVFKQHEGSHRFAIDPATLEKLLSTTEFAISTEASRYYLNGTYLHLYANGSGQVFRATTTDGHRLACADTAVPSGAEGMPGVIVPRDTVKHLRKLLDGTSEVTLSVSPSTIEVDIGDTVLRTKIIDGTFPDYMRVIPQNNDKVAVLDVAVLKEAAGRVSTIADNRRMQLDFTAGALKLSINNPDIGTSEEDIDADYENESLTIGFNSKYVGNILDQIDTERVEIRMSDAGSPTLFKPVGNENSQFVLMPLRI